MIKIYRTFNNELKEIWLQLEQRSHITPFQYYNWLLNWHQTAGSKYSLFIVCIKFGDQVEAILPLGIDSTRIVKTLEWLGGSHNDYMSPILDLNSEKMFKDIHSIWSEVISALPKFDVLHLAKQVPRLGNMDNPFLNIYPSNISMNSYQSKIGSDWAYLKRAFQKKYLLTHEDKERDSLTLEA